MSLAAGYLSWFALYTPTAGVENSGDGKKHGVPNAGAFSTVAFGWAKSAGAELVGETSWLQGAVVDELSECVAS
jgi:hypothetical protein